jgi:hypothetical protein
MTDHRIGLDLFNDVLDVLHRHGFTRGDDQHAGRAIFLIGDLARIYEGSQDRPDGPAITQAPYPPPPELPGPEPDQGPSVHEDNPGAVTLTNTQVKAVLTSLDLGADWNRNRAETCTYCADQSCSICELRLQEARTYDQIAAQLLHDEQAARTARTQAGRHAGPGLSADKEAGQ